MVNNQGSIDRKHRIYIAGIAFILFFITAAGIFTFLTSYSSQSVGFTLAYVAGLSMIFLPSTLPLAFIITPIFMNESPRESMISALSFGAGMMTAFGIYGMSVAYAGEVTYLLTANVIAGIVGGGFAYVIGLSELGLIKMNIPKSALPDFIHKQRDYPKMFLIGILLANVEVWVPNPVFYVFLADIITTANIFAGWSIMAAYGMGMATSMMFVIILGIIGINAVSSIKKRIFSVEKATDWGLVSMGAFMITLGGLFRKWYNQTAFHHGWNNTLISLTDGRIGEVETVSPELHDVLKTVPQWFGLYVFILLLAIPLILHFYRKGKLEFVGVSRKQKLSKKIRDA